MALKIRDKFKTNASFGGLKPPKLKGEVVVQLFDIKTGKLEKEVKGTNMQTNAVRDIFVGNYLGLVDYNSMMPLATELYGGILCFHDNLPEDADAYYPPTTNTNSCTAHAGQTAPTAEQEQNDPTRGKPIASESGPVTGGHRVVFEFGSNQGNGVINCLALTHKDTGDCWLKDSEYVVNKASEYTGGEAQGTEGGSTRIFPQVFQRFARKGYGFNAKSSTVLTISEFKGFGAIKGVGLNQRKLSDPSDNSLVRREFDVTVPHAPVNCRVLYDEEGTLSGVQPYSSSATYSEGSHSKREGHIYVCTTAITQAEEWNEDHWARSGGFIHLLYPSGSTIDKTVIDLDSGSASTSQITVSGANMGVFDASSSPYIILTTLDADGFIYIQGNSVTKVYKIKYTSPANVTEITVPDIGTRSLVINGVGHMGVAFSGRFNTQATFVIDGNISHQVKCDSWSTYDTTWNKYNSFINPNGSPIFYGTAQKRYEYTVITPKTFLCKLFMSTIFNLPQPVSKTSNQSMKIYYTLTEVEDEEA